MTTRVPRGTSVKQIALAAGEGPPIGPEQKAHEKRFVGSLTSSPQYSRTGLVKKTLCIGTIHVISYFTLDDVESGKLRRPSDLPHFASLSISPGLSSLVNTPGGLPQSPAGDSEAGDSDPSNASSSSLYGPSRSEARITSTSPYPAARPVLLPTRSMPFLQTSDAGSSLAATHFPQPATTGQPYQDRIPSPATSSSTGYRPTDNQPGRSLSYNELYQRPDTSNVHRSLYGLGQESISSHTPPEYTRTPRLIQPAHWREHTGSNTYTGTPGFHSGSEVMSGIPIPEAPHSVPTYHHEPRYGSEYRSYLSMSGALPPIVSSTVPSEYSYGAFAAAHNSAPANPGFSHYPPHGSIAQHVSQISSGLPGYPVYHHQLGGSSSAPSTAGFASTQSFQKRSLGGWAAGDVPHESDSRSASFDAGHPGRGPASFI